MRRRFALFVLPVLLASCGPQAGDMDEFREKVRIVTEGFEGVGLKTVAVGRVRLDKIGGISHVLQGPWEVEVTIVGWMDPAKCEGGHQ